MCGGHDSLTVLDNVDCVGYDPDMVTDATCFEDGPDRESEKAFLELSKSDEFLADFKVGDLDFASVACTHFNQSMCAVEAGIPWTNESITIDGRLSFDRLAQRHSKIGDLRKQGGLKWNVWKRYAEVLYPDLPDIIQRAINSKYAAQQTENWFHMYHRAIVVINSKNAIAALDPIKYTINDLLKTRPKCAEDVPHIVDMARMFGGSSTKTFADPVAKFARMFMKQGRIIPGTMFKGIAALKLEPGDFCPHFMNSISMYLAAAPAKTAPQNIAKAMLSPEIAAHEKENPVGCDEEC